ncbi:MAG: PPC domain-containing protein [Myxococcales bacterium]|nr:PPC domain-containing protein [Myxococcales bacterium]MCB9626290.1 PPC domain-containing protein [Sandaracinaceae bacterium]
MPHIVSRSSTSARRSSSPRPRSVASFPVWLAVGTAGLALGCHTGGAGLEPRYVAVHNAMTAMGLAQTGAISEGRLEEGGEARLEVELGAGQCYTFMALGGSGTRDMGVQVLSEAGEELGRDLTHDRQAAAQACPERAGVYQVVVTMNEGHGTYLVTSWSGAPAVARAGRGGGHGQGSGQGSCADPQSIALGETVRGNTTGGPSMMQGSCVQSGNSPEHVYAFTVTERAMVDIALESSFDGALYLMTACGTNELACNDDNPDTAHSRLRVTLDPGTYYVAVDGYGSPSQGDYSLSVQAQSMQSVAQVCSAAPPLTPGVPVRGDTSGSADYFQATCAGGAHSPDNVYRLSVAQPSRLRLRQSTPGHDGAIYVRSACDAAASEVMCNDDHGTTAASMVTGVLQPGEYFVFSDGYSGGQSQAAGSYELVADLAPLTGGQANGDTCASPLPQQVGNLAVDTFQASDDMAGSCGGQGAPDVVMALNVTARSRLRVNALNSEFNGVVYVRGGQCAVATGEVACGQLAAGAQGLDTVLAPGTYHLVIDGADASSFGQADLDVQLEDLAAMERMCRTAARITPGRTINGTTVGESDNFQATCAGNAASPDRVYQLRLTRRMTVRAHMTTTDFDGALHIRRDCADATTEVACNDDFEGQRQSMVETTLDAGTYFIIVDGFSRNNAGSYSLRVDTTRP